MRLETKKEKNRERQRRWRAANPDKLSAASRRYRVAHKEELLAAQRKWTIANPQYAAQYRATKSEKVKASNRKWYAANLEKCRERGRKKNGLPEPTRPMPELCEADCGRKASHLDHCHETGLFRGWLCNHCNLGLGKIGDNEAGVLRILQYLQTKARLSTALVL